MVDIDTFTTLLRNMMYERFPYEDDAINLKKHKGRTGHIRDVAFMNLPILVNIDTRTFDIGSHFAESRYPYYHILQDAPVIRKKGKADARSRGSQANILPLGLRDYNKISFNGKTYSREYQKNVRGKRASVLTNAILGKSDSYLNVHYKYIDRMLDDICPLLANSIGATLKVSHSGLKDDFAVQEEINRVLEREETMQVLDTMSNPQDYDIDTLGDLILEGEEL